MGSSWSAWLPCALLSLLLLIVPLSYAEDAVSFAQFGLAKEPFDVDGTIIYNIPVNNTIGHDMLYTVDLKVGSDRDYPYLFNKYENRLNVNAHTIGHVTFDVNFHSPEIYKGSFGKWASDKNDTSLWTKAWYSATITPLVGRSIPPLVNYEGRPQLCKPFFEFKKARVNPTQGSNKDHYSYEVTVVGNYGDNISLQVGPSRDGPWTDLGSKEYTTPNVPQALIWDNNSLDFDFNIAYYKFSGRRSSTVFDGPFWPVEVDYRNDSVTPKRGLSSMPFSYSLDVNASKKIDVGLNVFDVSSKAFKLAGRASYKNTSQWEKVEWTNVQPSEIFTSEGRSNYYFSFYYPESEVPFLSTYDKSRKYFPGPDLVLVEFDNATVTPENGSLLTPYNYSIEVKTALPKADVELQTSDPGSSVWNSCGIFTYDGSDNSLSWTNVKVDGESDGLARYRFLCGASSSDVYIGPRIGFTAIKGMVEPSNGSLYFTTPLDGSISSVYTYIYTAEINQVQGKEPIDIRLEIYDPVSRRWTDAGLQTYEPGMSNLSYKVNFANLFNGPFLGETKYRFISRDRILGEFSGPNIDVNLRNESAVEVGSTITYRVEVRSSLSKIPVALDYTTDNVKWQHHKDIRTYESNSQEWKILEWKTYPRYYAYEFEALREQT